MNHRHFTLLEVLLATSISLVLALALVGSLGSGIRSFYGIRDSHQTGIEGLALLQLSLDIENTQRSSLLPLEVETDWIRIPSQLLSGGFGTVHWVQKKDDLIRLEIPYGATYPARQQHFENIQNFELSPSLTPGAKLPSSITVVLGSNTPALTRKVWIPVSRHTPPKSNDPFDAE